MLRGYKKELMQKLFDFRLQLVCECILSGTNSKSKKKNRVNAFNSRETSVVTQIDLISFCFDKSFSFLAEAY